MQLNGKSIKMIYTKTLMYKFVQVTVYKYNSGKKKYSQKNLSYGHNYKCINLQLPNSNRFFVEKKC